MKILFNLTTFDDDLMRFKDCEDFVSFMKDFDGVELMYFQEDVNQIVPKERVIGWHMPFFPFWVDFWNYNEKELLKEFDTKETWERYYGGSDRKAIIEHFREDLRHAHEYGAEYVVFHVSDAGIEESFTWKYHHSDEEVIDATAELLNELFKDEDSSVALLLENLWQPGLSFTCPDMTRRLLEKVKYSNKGLMLDTGHLLHTNLSLRTQEDGLEYIHQMLDQHGELCTYIRGMHLNQSLTGAYCEETMKHPPKMKPTYVERYDQMFWHAFSVDQHFPFTCEGVAQLIERIQPEYVTFEFITENREQHANYLKQQLEALKK